MGVSNWIVILKTIFTMSKAVKKDDDDDWETDPDYVNDVSEQEQRWGGRKRDAGAIDMDQFRKDILKEDEEKQKKKVENIGQAEGYRPGKDSKEVGSK